MGLEGARPRTHRCVRTVSVTPARGLLAVAVALVALAISESGVASTDTGETASEIRAEARLGSSSELGRPLPLAALWNAGWTTDGYTPAVQIQMVQGGHHILPTLYLPTPSGATKGWDYYGGPIEEAGKLGLPVTFKSTQWEAQLLDDSKAATSSVACAQGIGLASKCLLPFGPVGLWE